MEQYLVDKGLEMCGLRDCLGVVKAQGQLPQGTPGECTYYRICAEVETFVRKVLPHKGEAVLSPLDVDLDLGEFKVEGRIKDIYAEGLLHYRYVTLKNKDRLRLWIYHLVLNARGRRYDSTLFCKDNVCKYLPIEESEKVLEVLLNLYWRGLSKPLHFFPESSWAYAESIIVKGETREKALERARKIWAGSDFSRGEFEDRYYQFCLAGADPLDEEFEKVAKDVFSRVVEFEVRLKA
jgi:exodeoxyribonuclease V gamma subunit